jgi:hypothetical protein
LNPIQAHYQAVLRPDKKRKMRRRRGIFKQEKRSNDAWTAALASRLANDRQPAGQFAPGLSCALQDHLRARLVGDKTVYPMTSGRLERLRVSIRRPQKR